MKSRFSRPDDAGGALSWRERAERWVWDESHATQDGGHGHARLVRVAYVLMRDLASGQLTLRAMSLVYTSLLSLVPLLAFSFSVLKAFGVHNQLEPLLATFLAPLGERGGEVASRVTGFIENVNVGVLGAAGLALLIYTVISLMQKIEQSFNFIWHVPHTRGLGERFSRYLSVLLVGPLLVFSAMGVTAAVVNAQWVQAWLAWSGLGGLGVVAERLAPYVLVAAAFFFMYVFIPNTRVRALPALAGALAGALLWQSAGWGFALIVGSSARYSAIYSGFAIVILFMIWLYLSWLIVLFGSSIAFYCQYSQYLLPLGGEPRLSHRVRERLALSMAVHIARAFLLGHRAPSQEELAAAHRVPTHGVAFLLDILASEGMCVRTEDGRFMPARDPAALSAHDVLSAVRTAGEHRYVATASLSTAAAADRLLDQVEAGRAQVLGGTSLAQLAGELAHEVAASQPGDVAEAEQRKHCKPQAASLLSRPLQPVGGPQP